MVTCEETASACPSFVVLSSSVKGRASARVAHVVDQLHPDRLLAQVEGRFAAVVAVWLDDPATGLV